jgi:hypothetical protein
VRRRDADRFYDEFLNTELELPERADEMPLHEGVDEDLVGAVTSWCRSANDSQL